MAPALVLQTGPDMWLVFHDEGSSLHSLMYSAKAPPPFPPGTPPKTADGKGTQGCQQGQAAGNGPKGTLGHVAGQQAPECEQTEQGGAGQYEAGQDEAGQCVAGQGGAGQCEAGQGEAGQGETGQREAGQGANRPVGDAGAPQVQSDSPQVHFSIQ